MQLHVMFNTSSKGSRGHKKLMIKFDRAMVIGYILTGVKPPNRLGIVTLTITGELIDGTPFEGSDTIRVLFPMPRIRRSSS